VRLQLKPVLDREEARRLLVGHHALAVPLPRGAKGARALLARLRCIQLDPLDVIGKNADLVALARIDGFARGDVYRHLFPGHAFEHFAKERCLLPASAFPHYRDKAAETMWWRLATRLKKLEAARIEAVLEEVRERGPVSAQELTDHGKVEPLDWHGWKGTGKVTQMALEVLWTRCQVVVAGRRGKDRLYDVPERALPRVASLPSSDFERWALGERVEAAGLLSRNQGPSWSVLHDVRTGDLPRQMLDEGTLEELTVEGSPRRYLAPAGFRDRSHPEPDGRMRILGPLDNLLWDRSLVRDVFGFDYVWEVYKPASERRWGYYVCPLLHRDGLVGRMEAAVEGDALVVQKLWKEKGAPFDDDAFQAALERHAAACGVSRVKRPRSRRG
jgi:uncharacterized protein